MLFDRTPPGFGLTTEPKGTPFENPPEITDPIESAKYHLDRMNTEESTEDLLYFLEQGLDIVTITQGIVRGGVFNGIHSIDVGLIIAPIIHEYIRDIAELSGMDFDEGTEDKNGKKVIKYSRDTERARKMLAELKIDSKDSMKKSMLDKDVPSEMQNMPDESLVEDLDIPDDMMPEKPVVEDKKLMGLMSKMEV